jgi:hypothetical protein
MRRGARGRVSHDPLQAREQSVPIHLRKLRRASELQARDVASRAALVLTLLILAVLASACGGARTSTVTVRHTVTRTVTTTATRTVVTHAPVAIYVPETGGPPQYKPSGIEISADSGNIWGIKRWLSYGGDTARAIATTWHENCTPSCAEGHRKAATTTIVLSDPIPCMGVPAYSGFEVMKSSDQQVASDGEEQDLSGLCKG